MCRKPVDGRPRTAGRCREVWWEGGPGGECRAGAPATPAHYPRRGYARQSWPVHPLHPWATQGDPACPSARSDHLNIQEFCTKILCSFLQVDSSCLHPAQTTRGSRSTEQLHSLRCRNFKLICRWNLIILILNWVETGHQWVQNQIFTIIIDIQNAFNVTPQ